MDAPEIEVSVFEGMHRFLPTLARIGGARITELPVNHRPRTRGKTKHGSHDRLGVGVADTLAVRRLERRRTRPRVRGERGGP